METQTTDLPVERISMNDTSRQFNNVFETLEAGDELFAEEAFFDLNLPVWRFQIQGSAGFAAQLRAISQGPSQVEVIRTVPTVSGFVTEHVEHQAVDGQDLSARRLWLCEVEGGRITQVTGYYTGERNDALRARHTLEAPMLLP